MIDEKKRGIAERHFYTDELIKELLKIERGGIYTYKDASVKIGLNVQGDGYRYLKSAKDIVERDEKIAFTPVVNVELKRLTPSDVAKKTVEEYLGKKRATERRAARRIRTVDDHWEELSQEEKNSVNMTRTILAFDRETAKRKNVLRLESKIKEVQQLIGFSDTIALFEGK